MYVTNISPSRFSPLTCFTSNTSLKSTSFFFPNRFYVVKLNSSSLNNSSLTTCSERHSPHQEDINYFAIVSSSALNFFNIKSLINQEFVCKKNEV